MFSRKASKVSTGTKYVVSFCLHLKVQDAFRTSMHAFEQLHPLNQNEGET